MRFEVQALLFDLDGTLVNSLGPVGRAWEWFSERHGLDASVIAGQVHGRRSIDTIRLLLPDADAEAEDVLMRAREASDTEGLVAVEGARALLSTLPKERWGIVTSGTEEVARARLLATGLPVPEVLISGELVERGKPAPDCYLLGAARLGFAARECLVFEDAGAGIDAAIGAGMQAIGVAAVGGRRELSRANAVVEDFCAVAVTTKPSSLFVIAWP